MARPTTTSESRPVELPTFDVLGESASLASAFAAVEPFRLNLTNMENRLIEN